MSASETINKYLDEIETAYFDGNRFDRSLFTTVRYKVDIENVSASAFARIIKDLCVENEPKNVFAVHFDFENEVSSNETKILKKKIKKITIVSNEKQNKIKEKTEMLINLLCDNDIIDNDSNSIDKDMVQLFFQELIDRLKKLEKKKKSSLSKLEQNIDKNILNEELLDKFYNIKIKDFNLYILIQDLILLLILNYKYDFSSLNRENGIIYKYCKQDNDEKFLHCECLLSLSFDSEPLNKFIGVSKLCCPLCNKFLKLYGFIYRGNHDRIDKSILNWRFKEYNLDIEERKEEILKQFADWINQLRNSKSNDTAFNDRLHFNIDESIPLEIDNTIKYDEDDFHLLEEFLPENQIAHDLKEKIKEKYNFCLQFI